MCFFLVLVDMSAKEFEVAGTLQEDTYFVVMINNFCAKTGRKITCYTPEVKKINES